MEGEGAGTLGNLEEIDLRYLRSIYFPRNRFALPPGAKWQQAQRNNRTLLLLSLLSQWPRWRAVSAASVLRERPGCLPSGLPAEDNQTSALGLIRAAADRAPDQRTVGRRERPLRRNTCPTGGGRAHRM